MQGGIYFVVSPKKEILFEILVDKDQNFSIVRTPRICRAAYPLRERPTTLNFRVFNFANKTGQEITRLNSELKNTSYKKRFSCYYFKAKDLESVDDFCIVIALAKKYPGSFLSILFDAIREPEIPPASSHPGGKYDSNYAYQYYKSNYWQGVFIGDERLVRTPFFEPKLEKYYKTLVYPNADSIKKEIDAMLLQARGSKEMFKYLLVHFVQKYINPEYMGQDAVFVHLFEKYINTGEADFFTPQYKEHMTKRAYSLMANLIGQPAANLEMVDTSGKIISLYNIQSEYTVICFWDPTLLAL